MLGKHKFKTGQRVRPSDEGIAGLIFVKTKIAQTGVVTKVDKFNCPTVLWEGRKTPKRYHADFIEPDRRKRK